MLVPVTGLYRHPPERSFCMGVPVSSRRSLAGSPAMAWLILDCPFCLQGAAGR